METTDDGDVETTSTALGLSGSLGVAVFATDSVSIAPYLALGYAVGSLDLEGDGFDEEANANTFSVTLGVTLSAWL